MNSVLGNRIKSLRLANNYTQEQVAEQLGVSRQKYARIENGNNNINLELLLQLANFFSVNIADITSVLDDVPTMEFRGAAADEADDIFGMLDVFYANKHMYERLKNREV